MTTIQDKLNGLSEALVFADLTDMRSLGEIHTTFQECAEWANQSGHPRTEQALHHGADLIERIVMNDVEDATAALGIVSRLVDSVQRVVRDNYADHEVLFPPELDLDTSAKADSNTEQPQREGKVVEADLTESMPLTGDPDLLREFVVEAQEHLENSDIHLLTLETTPTSPDAVNAVFRAFHTIKGVAGFLSLSEVQKLAHEAENLLDKARKGSLSLAGPTMDVTFDAVDMMKAMVGNVASALQNGGNIPRQAGLNVLIERLERASRGELTELTVDPKPLGELMIAQGTVSREDVDMALEIQKTAGGGMLGEILVREKLAAPKEVAQALRTQQTQSGGGVLREPLKVDPDRLDSLVDTIGELIISASMVVQSEEIKHGASTELLKHLSQLDKMSREVQQLGMGLRMVPLKPTFQKMARLVRDLAKKFSKEVDFVTTGEETELDKSMVEKIGDPLVHMIRNSLDHGLEATPEERERAGKPRNGRIHLRAFQKSGAIYIEIQDDGRGLNRDAILHKARERGLVAPDETPTDKEIWNLIFEPGFSTAKTLSDVSGRGVGMDVVRKNIDALRGHVDVHSELGKGCTISIRLPLTLAIIDGMVVTVGGERYIIPTLSIVRSIRPTEQMIHHVAGGNEMLMLQDRLIPLARLSTLFAIPNAETSLSTSLIVLVEVEGKQLGIVVDKLLGEQQIVIKTMGSMMKKTPGVSGGAIMPDGRVGLILDVDGIFVLLTEDFTAGSAQHAYSEVASQ